MACAAVAKLMADDAADLVFTDPPYNVDYEGYTEEQAISFACFKPRSRRMHK